MDLGILLVLIGIGYLLSRKSARGKELREDPEEMEYVQPISYTPPQTILNLAYTPYAEFIHAYAEEQGIKDPLIIPAIIFKESSGNPWAEGQGTNPDTRGLGLMQITLSTAQWIGYKGEREELKDPDINIQWGTKYLGYLMKKEKSWEDILMRYRGSTNQTTNEKYAQKVLSIYDSLLPFVSLVSPERGRTVV